MGLPIPGRTPMTSLKGHLLVATPDLLAPIFNRSVILMLEHSGEGAAGVVLNRPTDATVASLAAQILDGESDWDKPIGLGGPVPGALIMLHAVEELADHTILPGVYSTVDEDKVRTLVRLKSEPSMALANYSGWSAGQLEGEIESGSWVTIPARPELVFWDGAEDLWKV